MASTPLFLSNVNSTLPTIPRIPTVPSIAITTANGPPASQLPFPFPSPVALLITTFVLGLSLYLIRLDYHAFISLGPGGTPSTLPGYLRIKVLSLFALSHPYTPAPVHPSLVPQAGYLSASTLPKRVGPRPIVRGIAPHRQTNQRAPASVFASLWDAIDELAAGHENKLRKGTSCLEKHGPGLFALVPVTKTRNCTGEICHAHPSDGSMHLTLHPADAKVLLEAGWGERHPLARGGWLSRFVPAGFVMVYAPRTEEEVMVVKGIVAAAVWWIGGIDALGDRDEREVGEGLVERMMEECRLGGLMANA